MGQEAIVRVVQICANSFEICVAQEHFVEGRTAFVHVVNANAVQVRVVQVHVRGRCRRKCRSVCRRTFRCARGNMCYCKCRRKCRKQAQGSGAGMCGKKEVQGRCAGNNFREKAQG